LSFSIVYKKLSCYLADDMKITRNDNNMQPMPPPIRDIDTVIAGMEATGKYSKKFLIALRKGMERSRTFQRAEAKPVGLGRKNFLNL